MAPRIWTATVRQASGHPIDDETWVRLRAETLAAIVAGGTRVIGSEFLYRDEGCP